MVNCQPGASQYTEVTEEDTIFVGFAWDRFDKGCALIELDVEI